MSNDFLFFYIINSLGFYYLSRIILKYSIKYFSSFENMQHMTFMDISFFFRVAKYIWFFFLMFEFTSLQKRKGNFQECDIYVPYTLGSHSIYSWSLEARKVAPLPISSNYLVTGMWCHQAWSSYDSLCCQICSPTVHALHNTSNPLLTVSSTLQTWTMMMKHGLKWGCFLWYL